jgi:hypothetical protein
MTVRTIAPVSKRFAAVIAAAAIAAFGMAGTATAQVIGFGGSSMTGWTPNTNTAGLPSVTGSGTSADVLTLTNNTNGIATSYWFNTPQSITNFKESFTYTQTTNTPNNGADGFAVVWQNAGTNALGGGGGQLGLTGIASSASLAGNIYGGNVIGTQYNNTVTAGNPVTLGTPGGVNIASGDAINVTLSYKQADGALTETMTDSVTNATFTRVWRGISIQGQVGGATALIGFTGATGGVNAGQTFTNFQFTPGAANPTPVAAFTPIAATGYNQNMIISTASGSANITATIDGGTTKQGNTFYETGVNPNASAAGVPHAGVFSSENDPNHVFQLQPNGAGQNDAVMLDQVNTTGALTLTTPARYSALSLLVAGGNGGATIGYTAHYAGGATQTGTFNIPDWFGNTPFAWDANGRVSLNPDGSINTTDFNATFSQNPRMLQVDLTPTDTVDALQSINFTWQGTVGNGDEDAIFGISGTAVPEPSSLALLSLGAVGLVVRRRRAARAK